MQRIRQMTLKHMNVKRMKQKSSSIWSGNQRFLRLAEKLAYIVLGGDDMDCFFLYGFNEKKSKVLYSAAKDRIPNAIITTSFKKHFHGTMRTSINEEFSSLFYSLPSITDQKEKINQHKENVNVNLIDCTLDYVNSFSPDIEVDFWPDLLNSADAELRRPQVKLVYQFFRQMAETSNANIIRNTDHLLATSNKDNRDIVWVGPTKQQIDTTKFKLTY